MSEEPQDKPKIIVDDDWKEQVQAEKEAAQQQEAAEEAPAESQAADPESEPELQLPPASFATLVSSLAAQAIASLGQMPDPEGKLVVRPELAKHAIDTLGVLEEKTNGNLSNDEAAMLENILHELRMMFVAVQNQPPPSADQTSGGPPPA